MSQIQLTLGNVKEYLTKSAFAQDESSDTGKLLIEVSDLLLKLQNDPISLLSPNSDSLVISNRSLQHPSALVSNQKSRATARLHRSQTVVASSRPNLLSFDPNSRSTSPGQEPLSQSKKGSFLLNDSLRIGGGGDSSSGGGAAAAAGDTLSASTGPLDSGGETQHSPPPDDDVADWLNKNFADTVDEREDTGFNIPVLRRESTVGDLSMFRRGGGGGSNTPTGSGNYAGADKKNNDEDDKNNNGGLMVMQASTHTQPPSAAQLKEEQKQAAVEEEEGHVVYTRSQSRKTNARESSRRSNKMLTSHGIEDLTDAGVHTPDFDIFALLDTYRRDAGGNLAEATAKVFVTVCVNVFFSYSFVSSLDFDVSKLVEWMRAAERLYGTNPYHNAVHAADVCQTTHIYMLTNEVYRYFSDTELFSVMFSAAAHDLGHLGTNNAFLQNIQHPTAVLYNDTSVQESYHTALAFHLLQQPGTDFLAGSKVWSEALFRDFRACVVDVIWGTDMKNHATLMQSATAILDDGIIEDNEVPALLRAIVHAADLSNPLKQWSVYIEWAARVVGEFWRQGDEEAKRGQKISPMCDRTGANFAKAQKGFIEFVVRPWMRTLASVLPAIWIQRLEDNLAMVNQMAQKEVDDVHVRITTHASNPLDDTVATRVLEALRVMMSPKNQGSLRTVSFEENPLLRAKQKYLEQKKQQGGGGGGDDDEDVPPSRSNNNNYVTTPMSELTVPEIGSRIKASWSEIIKGLTSRGSLSTGSAVEQWARVLLEAHSCAPLLKLPADSSAMQSLTSDVPDTVRAALEKLTPSDFTDVFSFVRTLNITILDMTRPVIKSACSSPLFAHSHSSPSARGGGGAVFVDHYGNNLQGHGSSGIQSSSQHPSTMLLSSDTVRDRSHIVRFFSEDRPVVVPLESRFLPSTMAPASAAGGGGNSSNNTPPRGDYGRTPSRSLMTPQ